jgi:hypothetical protein
VSAVGRSVYSDTFHIYGNSNKRYSKRHLVKEKITLNCSYSTTISSIFHHLTFQKSVSDSNLVQFTVRTVHLVQFTVRTVHLVQFTVRTVHLVQFTYVPCILYSLLYVPCILYSLLSRPTNTEHTYTNNILYIVNIPTRFDASASFSGSLILLLCYESLKVMQKH